MADMGCVGCRDGVGCDRGGTTVTAFLRNWWRVDPGGLVIASGVCAAPVAGLLLGALVKWGLS